MYLPMTFFLTGVKQSKDTTKMILLSANPEKRAKLYLIAWIVSMLVMIFGYIIIFYTIYMKK